MIEDVLRKKYRPYHDVELLPRQMVTWNSDRPIFEELIRSYRPSRIIEVGTWMGGSAIHMAEICKRLGLNTRIICVDTWLGGVDQILSELPQDNLHCRGGFPDLYRQFVSNVIYAGLQDVIVPFPQTSLSAARFMAHYGVRAEIIYIDASHERIDVIGDLVSYWPLATGAMFGDDYAMPGVCAAVNKFATNEKAPAVQDGVHWCFRRGDQLRAPRPGV